MEERAVKLLKDARGCVDRIERFTADQTASTYLDDELVRSAVERQFEIIGEALGVLRRTFPHVAARIPDLAKMVGFRNLLVHQYDGVRNDVVWLIKEIDIPPLARSLDMLLAEAGSTGIS